MARQALTTYQKLCTEFYDLEHHKDHHEALAFYLAYARKAAGPILEPMCGTGRFLLPMLQEGLPIEGFDASPYMLAALQQKYAPQTAPVSQQFVQDFCSKKQYKLIFIPYGSFGLITETEDIIKSLAVLYCHLAPGGKLVMDIETVSSVPQPCGIWRRGVHTRNDGSYLAINTLTSYDQEMQLFKSLCQYESIQHGTITAIETEDYQQYLYHFDEMDKLLEATGFSKVNTFTNYAKAPANNPQAPLLIYECTK